MLVISIGLGIFLRYLFNIQFGGFTRTYAQFSLQRDGIEIGPVNLVPRDLIGMIISVDRAGRRSRCSCSAPRWARRRGRWPTTATWPSRRASTSTG